MNKYLLLFAVCASAQEWTSLFDGKTFNGWEPRATFAAPATGDWKILDGAIYCGGATPGWLATTKSFSDFRLQLEFKGPANVNSGVFLRSKKEGQPHVTGYELQIWDMQPQGFLTGSLVGTVKAPPTDKIKGDAWNAFDITARGDHFIVVMNGKTVLDHHDKQHASGVIGFQCQADQKISFRNIRIQELKQAARFEQRTLEDTKGEERVLAERFLKETRTGLGGPWNIMLRSPEMSTHLLEIYNYFRWKTKLPKNLMEEAIMIVARDWSVQFEWFAHYPISLKEGVPAALLADIRVGKRPESMKPEEAVVYDFTTELCRNRVVSKPTFERALTTLGEKNVVDLTAVIGTYISIGALLNVAEVPGAAKDGPDYLPPL